MSQVHENEIMRAFKTVNDSYIEPISFTVPRRAETFQSDIYPPAVGSKPAMSAKEWLDGKTAVPAKIDLESIYDGTAPVEVVSDFKPAPASAPAPARAPVVAPAPKKEPEPAPVAYRAPPTAADQKASISNMANKYQDNEESSDDDDAETSSFEEISRPVARAAAPVSAPAPTKAPAPAKTPVTASPPVSRAAPAAASASPSDAGLLAQIKDLFDNQNKMIAAQGDKITAQSEIISQLAADVEGLKKRVGPGSQEQSERIRQLELELEEARS
jgi:coronin-1B/1C/6